MVPNIQLKSLPMGWPIPISGSLGRSLIAVTRFDLSFSSGYIPFSGTEVRFADPISNTSVG